MKTRIKWLTVLGCLAPITLWPAVAAGSYAADFQRMQWFCSDYQIPVEGYVIEGWFQLTHVPGMERFLQEQLQITRGYHQVTLTDGSVVSTNMQRKDDNWQITLQLVSKNQLIAAQYYNRWQQFFDRYSRDHPVGITVIAQLPESLDTSVSATLIQELADGLDTEPVSQIVTDRYVQYSCYSPQLTHKLQINGEAINSSITVVPGENCSYMYIASPVLYQQI